jgi:hypothetical protein
LQNLSEIPSDRLAGDFIERAAKVRAGFLRVLRFPPTGSVEIERVGWDKPQTDPSTRWLCSMIRHESLGWLPEAPLEDLQLERPWSIKLQVRMIGTSLLLTKGNTFDSEFKD